MADLRESVKGMFYTKKGVMMVTPSLFGEKEKVKNFIKESGVLGRSFMPHIDKKGIVSPNIKYDILQRCYMKIPKVFRAVNMRAEFAVQGGFKIQGNDNDVKILEKWKRMNQLDPFLLTIVRNMLVFGNCFVEISGSGKDVSLHFLPVERMRVIRDTKEIDGKTYFMHDIKGYAQMDESGTNVISTWENEEKENIIHFKWNWNGTDAYGISEIIPAMTVLADKLDAEAVIPRILKFHADARIIYRCGKPENPHNKTTMTSFIGDLEERVVGGDVAVPGDVEPVVIQPKSNPEIIELLNHVEQQVDCCLNSPATSLLTGNMDGQTSQTLMDSMERDVKTIQDFLFIPFERYIFPKIIGKRDVPEIKPNPMNIETFLRLSRTLRQLVGKRQERPIITIDEARKEAGYGQMPDSELEKMMMMGMEPSKEDGDESGEEIPPDGEES